MRKVWLTLCAGCFAASLSAATIGFQVSNLGPSLVRYTYFDNGFTFSQNQELDIQFDPSVRVTLSNGQAPIGFNVLLLQPNNPPGAPGEYSALALVNNPSTNGIFSVDFMLSGAGTPQGSQSFVIGSFDTMGKFTQVAAGATTPQGTSGVPEPTSLSLAGLGLLIGTIRWGTTHRRARVN